MSFIRDCLEAETELKMRITELEIGLKEACETLSALSVKYQMDHKEPNDSLDRQIVILRKLLAGK